MFQVPEFNLTLDVYTMVAPFDFDTKAYRNTFPCQLRGYGQHPRVWSTQLALFTVMYAEWAVLLPAGSDIRDASCTGATDIIEVVPGSGRWYAVTHVDDVAKGFANEYRMATLAKIGPDDAPQALNFPYWPTPIP